MSVSIQLKRTIHASLMAALIAVGAFISIPIGPVPIVLQNFFVLLTGLLLGRNWGLGAVATYLLVGIFGVPVFAGGTGGIGRLLGPTGGYLLGYLPAVYVVGWISEKKPPKVYLDVVALVCGTAIVYACGVPWLKIVTGMPFEKALAVGLLPFLLGDALKIAAAIPVVNVIRPFIK